MMRRVDPTITGKVKVGFVCSPEECGVGYGLGVRSHFVMLLIR
jgi:hypothetical protein